MIVHLAVGDITADVDTQGAQLISCKRRGDEKIWTGDTRYWGGHSPVLFPTIGAVLGGKKLIGGQPFALPRHGFVRDKAFRVVRQSGGDIHLRLEQSGETLAVYPFNFALDVTIALTGRGFSTEFNVTNTGTVPMPYTIGGHPGFLIGSLEDYLLTFALEEDDDFLYPDVTTGLMSESLRCPVGLADGKSWRPKYSDFVKDTFVKAGIRSSSVTLANADGRGVRLGWRGFSSLAVWTPPGKRAPFVCLEPWQGLPSFAEEGERFEDKMFAVTLAPGQSESHAFYADFLN